MRRVFGEEPGVVSTVAAASAVPLSGIVLLFGVVWALGAMQGGAVRVQSRKRRKAR